MWSGRLSEREALLGAVCADPGTDLPRLVFADWLEENGEEHYARFVRLQIQADALLPTDSQAREMHLAAERLKRGRSKSWRRDLPRNSGVAWGPFRRGFVGDIEMIYIGSAKRVMESIAGRVPIDGLRWNRGSVARTTPDDRAFRESPWLAGVTRFTSPTSPWGFSGAAVEALSAALDSPFMGRLTELDLSNPGGRSDLLARVLARPELSGLRRLRLNMPPEDAQAGAMWSGAGFDRLDRLELTGLSSRVESVLRPLFRSSLLGHLRQLDLGGGSPLARTLFHALAEADLRRLHTLGLASTQSPADAVAGLIESGALPRLQGLIAADCGYRDADIKQFTGPAVTALKRLDLSGNHLTDIGSLEIVDACGTDLERLDLTRNHVSPAGRRELRRRLGDVVIV